MTAPIAMCFWTPSFALDPGDGVDAEGGPEPTRATASGTGGQHPLERVRAVPYLLAGLLGAMALVSVVVTLATAARRRRREVAVLRALGLARGQLRCLLAGEATTFVGLALLVGLPLGVVAGRLAWTLAADGLGTEGGPAVPVVTVGAAVGAVNLYAQGRATAVARRWPGADLRTE